MKLPRFRIGDLMAISVVVAADIAAGRAIVANNENAKALCWLAAVMPMTGVLQCIALWLRSGRRRLGSFWISAFVSGTLALGSLVWYLVDPPSEVSEITSSGVVTFQEVQAGALPARLWSPYHTPCALASNRPGFFPISRTSGGPVRSWLPRCL